MAEDRIQTGTKIHFGDDVGEVIEFLEEPNSGLCLLEIEARGVVFDLPVGLLKALVALQEYMRRAEENKAILTKAAKDLGEERNEALRLLSDGIGTPVEDLSLCGAIRALLKDDNKERAEEAFGRRFPIQGGPSIPWQMILPHDRQCKANHGGQDLKRIAERMGLSPNEALAVLDDESWSISKWGNFTTEWKARETHPKIIAAKEELERRRAAFEDPIKKLEEELETVHANWDADRQELEDVIADSVPIRPDEKEVSAELLQIVHAIVNCDENAGRDKLCPCTRYIRDRFEALRSHLNKAEGLLREFRNTLNVADIEPKVGITKINEVFGEETCRTCGVVLTDERTAKKADGFARLDSFGMPWCDACAARADSQ